MPDNDKIIRTADAFKTRKQDFLFHLWTLLSFKLGHGHQDWYTLRNAKYKLPILQYLKLVKDLVQFVTVPKKRLEIHQLSPLGFDIYASVTKTKRIVCEISIHVTIIQCSNLIGQELTKKSSFSLKFLILLVTFKF